MKSMLTGNAHPRQFIVRDIDGGALLPWPGCRAASEMVGMRRCCCSTRRPPASHARAGIWSSRHSTRPPHHNCVHRLATERKAIASSPWRASDHRAGARSRPGARKSPLRSIRSCAVPPFGWQVQRYLLDSVCSAAFGARRIAAEENGCVTVSPSGVHAFDYRVVVEGVGQHQADRVYLGDSSRRRRWFETLLDAIDIAPFGARCRRVGVRPPMIAPSAPAGALNLVLRNIRLGAATATVLSSR